MARLILNCEGVGLMMCELGRDIIMIGRAPLNQIVIDHPTISAQHAVLLRTGTSYSLKDLNSTNGTRINGDFVTDAELKDGDTIRFGSVTAVFAGIYRKRRSRCGIRNYLDQYFELSGHKRSPSRLRVGLSDLPAPD
jgi:pSer/pThr/pTyr-binding forkhead associated (FHA) protein